MHRRDAGPALASWKSGRASYTRRIVRNLRRVLSFFATERPLAFAAAGLLGLQVIAGLLRPWPLAWLVDCVIGSRPLPAGLASLLDGTTAATQLVALAVAVAALHLGHTALGAAQNFLLIRAGLRGLARVRQAVFARLLRLSIRSRVGTTNGDLVYRATWDTCAFQTLFQHGLFAVVTHSLTLGLMLLVMVRLSPLLTLIAVATAPCLILLMRAFGPRMQAASRTAHAAEGRVAALAQQGLDALGLQQASGGEPRLAAGFAGATADAQRLRQRQHGTEIIYLVAIALIFAIGTAVTIGLGARQVLTGQLTLGTLLVFLAYLGQLYEPLNQLSHAGVTWADATAGTQRVFELLDTPADPPEAPRARAIVREPAPPADPAAEPPLVVRGALEFVGVSCGYDPGRPVLSDLSFRIEPGRTVALVGPSGAGKTTLLQLLPRFLDPTRGRIQLDGADVRSLRLADLRRQIAWVVQDPILIPGTIGENIGIARPDATPAEIVAAAQAAQADAFIRALPQGYETSVGEGAARLSAGEKQRLNLARAFLRNAPLLLLDEPTTALDAANEALVAPALRDLRAGRTTLLVTHRRALLAGVDWILVLERGRLTESGPPDQLLSTPSGYCARMIP